MRYKTGDRVRVLVYTDEWDKHWVPGKIIDCEYREDSTLYDCDMYTVRVNPDVSIVDSPYPPLLQVIDYFIKPDVIGFMRENKR